MLFLYICFSASFIDFHFLDVLCKCTVSRQASTSYAVFYCSVEALEFFALFKTELSFYFCLFIYYWIVLSYEFFTHVFWVRVTYQMTRFANICSHSVLSSDFGDEIACGTNVFNFDIVRFI